MKKRKLMAPGFNNMTGYGSGLGMREGFGGDGRFGWFSHDDCGCLDAPRDILSGSLYAGNDGAGIYQGGSARGEQ